MKKIKMMRGTALTFEEGCNKYLEYCRQRNLREGTIRHYRQSFINIVPKKVENFILSEEKFHLHSEGYMVK